MRNFAPDELVFIGLVILVFVVYYLWWIGAFETEEVRKERNRIASYLSKPPPLASTGATGTLIPSSLQKERRKKERKIAIVVVCSSIWVAQEMEVSSVIRG